MVKLTIDGSQHTGNYRVDCECGDNWIGRCERLTTVEYLPCLPIAECVVHMRLSHPLGTPFVYFTARFEQWLKHYWELASLRQATASTRRR